MIVLFDGFCVLCSGFARWLKRQYEGKVQLKAMQSDEGQELLKKYGYPADDPDEVVVIDGQTSMSGASDISPLTSPHYFPSPRTMVRMVFRKITKSSFSDQLSMY